MRILLAHNYYQQRGGEDVIFETEAALLKEHGHDVSFFTLYNAEIHHKSKAALVRDTLWNRRVQRELTRFIKRDRPEVVHFHNTFPLISPAAYQAVRAAGVPVIQALNNFRLFCLNGFFLRRGAVCEACLGRRVAWPGVARRCYRDSAGASAVVAALFGGHRFIGTWASAVDLWVVNGSPFVRRKFIQGGLPPHKVALKPNVIHPDPGPGRGDGGYAIFVGRLSPEKGLDTLLEAWRLLGPLAPPLKVVGDGPLAGSVSRAVAELPDVQWLGQLPLTEVMELMGRASFLVFPSRWYETFGRVGAEAMARGTPVIASRLGAMEDLVDHGRTGLLIRPGNPGDLAAAVRWLAANPHRLAAMRAEARAEYLACYAAAPVYAKLMKIYRLALEM
jgi:glycosyltransferase involved in cell wall biosynthesis